MVNLQFKAKIEYFAKMDLLPEHHGWYLVIYVNSMEIYSDKLTGLDQLELWLDIPSYDQEMVKGWDRHNATIVEDQTLGTYRKIDGEWAKLNLDRVEELAADRLGKLFDVLRSSNAV